MPTTSMYNIYIYIIFTTINSKENGYPFLNIFYIKQHDYNLPFYLNLSLRTKTMRKEEQVLRLCSIFL